jgi:outer membrane protein assembly factor BamB
MKQTLLLKVLPAAAAVLAALLVAFWWSRGGSPLAERVPGQDQAAGDAASNGSAGKWEGKLLPGKAAIPTGFSGVWPGFRGPNLDGISREKTPLARTWPSGRPPLLWKLPVGEGFAAPAIWKGRVFLLDYDREARADALRCLSLADGQEIWRYTYPVRVKRNHGMSRTIPAVTDQYLVSLGPKCHVICVDPMKGELRWKLDLVHEYHAEVPPWYAGQCPLIDRDRLILGTGGDALVIAVDLASGKVLWKSPNPAHWQMTHSSITPIEFKGQRMYVYCASGGAAGVSAVDGQFLWQTSAWQIAMANIPSPLYLGDGRIFLSGGYNAGSMILQLRETGQGFSVEPVLKLKPNVFGATQQTPILYQNHVLGVRPDGQFVCLSLEGKTVWESGAANKYGLGPFMIAQDLLYVMNDEGLLTLAEASTKGFKKLAQAKVLEGPDAWGPMALADGHLILRDMNQMICVDVSSRKKRAQE